MMEAMALAQGNPKEPAVSFTLTDLARAAGLRP
jgi:hypothetical protein